MSTKTFFRGIKYAKATVASAKAQEHINKIVSGGDKAKSSMESFERYEKKAEKMLDAVTKKETIAGEEKTVTERIVC